MPAMFLATVTAVALQLRLGALPPGPGPFTQTVLPQPVRGALVFPDAKVCDVSKAPYSAVNNTNSTAALRQASTTHSRALCHLTAAVLNIIIAAGLGVFARRPLSRIRHVCDSFVMTQRQL